MSLTLYVIARNEAISTIYYRMKIHQYYVYILTNSVNTVLYVGVTNDLVNRVLEHKKKINAGFTSKYNCNKLVYFEEYQWIDDAIAREKQLKGGSRQRKVDLVIIDNPSWNDLSADWYD
jgi:putative endonuclease